MKSRARHGALAVAVLTVLAAPPAWAQHGHGGGHSGGGHGGGHSSGGHGGGHTGGSQGSGQRGNGHGGGNSGGHDGTNVHSNGSGHPVDRGHANADHVAVGHSVPQSHVATRHVDGPSTVQRSHSRVRAYASFGSVYGHTHVYPHYGYYSSYRYVPYYGYYGSYGYGYAAPFYDGSSYGSYFDRAPASQYPARLRIVDAPPSAEVYVDGYYAGIVDDYDGVSQHLELTPGPHRIEIRAPGFEPITFDLNAIDRQTIIYRARMIPL